MQTKQKLTKYLALLILFGLATLATNSDIVRYACIDLLT